MNLLRQKSFINEKPTLYLVPTPIGNLEDMTFRSVRILKETSVIFAEDTRVSQKILSHFEIKKPLKSYHEHNKMSASSDVLSYLRNGESVSLISDAGMPLISDPGFEIVLKAREEGFSVVSLPGANALLTALVASGIRALPFSFYGFLDSKKNKRIQELEELKYHSETLIFYEAPHRLVAFLEDMHTVLGNRMITIARELTKSYEEIIHGTILECLSLEPLKGEMVVIVEGFVGNANKNNHFTIVEQVDFFIEEGLSKTEAMKKVSELTGVPKNKIYQEYLNSTIK